MRCFFQIVSILLLFSCARFAVAADEPIPYTTRPNQSTRWYDAKHLTLEGRGWDDVANYYDRLPAKAEKMVRDSVWNLAQHSAGMCIHFVADTNSIDVHWKLRSDGEDTVDGSHPTDVGFMRYADVLTPILTNVLPK